MNSSRMRPVGMVFRTSVPLAASLAIVALTACSSEQKPADASPPAAAAAPEASRPLTAEERAEITVTAKVKAIDYATRVVTLVDKSGHEMTIVADKTVKRLNEVSVGDDVVADYVVSVLGELRPPTADEAAHPIMVVAAAGRATAAHAPMGAAATVIKVVTTVEAVDLPNMRVTLRGPMGDSTTVKAKKPENVKKLRIGDTIVITYTEAMAISLDKVATKK